MSNKNEYQKFLTKTYVPIYSQPWWLDAICGTENWDVWLYKKGESILAAMPYYFENRGEYRYITKAPLTQNNGIIFFHDSSAKIQTKAALEEEIIDNMCKWLKSQMIDVYEQQYMNTFVNWQPFFWNGFSCVLRYSYIINNNSLFSVFDGYSKNLRKKIRKGERNTEIIEELDPNNFFNEHEKIFTKQNMKCPFSLEVWNRLFSVCKHYNCGMSLCAKNHIGKISSLVYLVWDDKYVYLLLGGAIPEYSNEESFLFLVHKSIEFTMKNGKSFDFEGSMIKRIAKAMRQFGGIPTPYYRIRKIYNPDIIRMEAEQEIKRLSE